MDQQTISEFGIPGFTLMEVAATKAADILRDYFPDKQHILFLCGKGNNAGDGLAIARLLAEQGCQCTVVMVAGTHDLSDDCAHNLKLLKRLPYSVSIQSGWEPEVLPAQIDVVIDGMLGVGIQKEVREPFVEAIEWVNDQEIPVIALDVPSGLNPDTGRIMGVSIQAAFTLAFGGLKIGFYLNDGKRTTGSVFLCELPIPNHLKRAAAYLIDESWCSVPGEVSITRTHKYEEGKVQVIAGSTGLTGAAILASRSAWGTGVGAVNLFSPHALLPVYEKQLEQIIKTAVGAQSASFFSKQDGAVIFERLNPARDVLLIGPGIGRTQDAQECVQYVLSHYKGRVVIDADALFTLSEWGSFTKPASAEWILTPHPGELARLTKTDVSDDFKRIRLVGQFSKQHGVTVLSKGYPCMIADSGGTVFLTDYDTRMFSRAGFGDVLAGKIAGFWLQQRSPFEAITGALLEGKHRADAFFKGEHKHPFEPLDLI